MKTREIRFRNNFHNTEAVARAKRAEWLNAMGPSGRESWAVSTRVMKRVARELCGVEGCTCGTLCGSQSDKWADEMWEAYQRQMARGSRVGISDHDAIVYRSGSWKGGTQC